MQVLCTVGSHGELRTFNGQRGDGTAIDVVIKSGNDTILASAFDKLADRFAKDEFNEQTLLSVDLVFSVNEHEGRLYQRARIVDAAIVFDTVKAF